MLNNDLISRSALVEEVTRSFDAFIHVAYFRAACDAIRAKRAVICMLNNAPAVDAVPVRHGRWEWYEEWSEIPGLPAECEEAGWRCSECKINLALYLTANTDEIIYIDDSDKMPTLERCPKCGTKMDMEVNDETD